MVSMPSVDGSSLGLRDFLYLDTDRVRSLLAQIDGGVVEQVVENAKTGAGGRAGAKLFGMLDLGGTLVREKASEQTKTLQDALYLIFEEAANQAGLFSGLNFHDRALWEDTVHDQLRPSELMRCTAPARILDSKLVRERVDRFLSWLPLTTKFDDDPGVDRGMTKKQRERVEQQRVTELLDGNDPAQVRAIGEFFERFLGGQISMRQFPCGQEHPQLAFTGTLLDRPGYLQEEREALFSKYGSAASEWTLVGQVATVPSPEPPGEIAISVADDDDDRIDRTGFEELGASLMGLMERFGIAEGPHYPTIAVTPLAIFRELPRPR